jgi:PadR family transcriptional regulator, regulatory protein PadR
MTELRITRQTEKILAAIAGEPGGEWWGSRICDVAGLKSGTAYPALMRMERFGWLTGCWEDIDPAKEGRPRKRFYKLTGKGETVARDLREAREAGTSVPREKRLGWGFPEGAAT